MFFQSWELWEKMTFILGISLLFVFSMGWIKLAYRIRRMKEQEVVDEEKRSRLLELRNNGYKGESRGKHDIPFGVRAIQSGIQVDGIWISNPNTPIPSELTLSSFPAESCDDLARPNSNPSNETHVQPRQMPNCRVRLPGRPDSYGYRAQSDLQEITEGKAARNSYKPRRSSHLRYGGNRDFNEETLDQLEGNTLAKKKSTSPRIRKNQSKDEDPDSSAADNERNSGTSDESDATLSHDPPKSDDQLCAPVSNSNITLQYDIKKIIEPLPALTTLSPNSDYIQDDITPLDESLEAMYSHLFQSEAKKQSDRDLIDSEHI